MPSAPAFWWRDDPTLTARALAPIGSIYGAFTAGRMRREGFHLDVPVLCVGNFVVGGAGKTPLVLELLRRLIEQGHRPAVLSRGYGRDRGSSAIVRVDPGPDTAAEVGDEPLLLARVAPTYVSADRVGAAAVAVCDGASVILLDDGLQNPALAKRLTISVVDGMAGIGNGLCLPAGPLRAPLRHQWPLVSALCVVGDGDRGADIAAQAMTLRVPVITAELEPDPGIVGDLASRRLLAFAGIGRPLKFFQTLERAGLHVAGTRGFPDHHRFSAADRAELVEEAQRLGAELVTTEKDRVRLPADMDCKVLPIRLAVRNTALLDGVLQRLRRA